MMELRRIKDVNEKTDLIAKSQRHYIQSYKMAGFIEKHYLPFCFWIK
ncbi:hypothetical protein V7201_14485 [Bacillus sp. JJ1122]